MDDVETQVTEVQMLYPRIYMACHVEHTKARSSEVQLSARDSSILVHFAKGLAAMKASSVLDSAKLAAVLGRLSPEQRALAIEGLRLLADAAVNV